jgi:catechol 2,3-dioxygenase-like lactoylglutathione lyase family enzyme
MALKVQRTTLVVRSLDLSLTFYKDVLGFTHEFTKDLSPTSYSYEVFGLSADTPLRFATLSTPDQPRTLGLIEWNDASFEPPRAPRTVALVVAVDDFDATVARAQAARFTLFREDRLVTHDGRVGREQAVLDPDGHLILLYTITSAAAPA